MVVGSLHRGPHWQVPPVWVQALALGGRFALPQVEQSSPLCGPPEHTGGWQAGSAQSMSPLQSLSIMSPQFSGPVGTQPWTVVVVVLGTVVVVVGMVVVVVTHRMWFCSHPPLPSQPAVVQALLSVSGQGVLSGTFGKSQFPVCGLQVGGPVQGLVSSVQVFTMWFWSQPSVTLPPVASVPLQPAVVQALLSVSVHGVLSATGVWLHIPVLWSHMSWEHSMLSLQSGQSGIELDCCPVEVRLLSHRASFWDAR